MGAVVCCDSVLVTAITGLIGLIMSMTTSLFIQQKRCYPGMTDRYGVAQHGPADSVAGMEQNGRSFLIGPEVASEPHPVHNVGTER